MSESKLNCLNEVALEIHITEDGNTVRYPKFDAEQFRMYSDDLDLYLDAGLQVHSLNSEAYRFYYKGAEVVKELAFLIVLCFVFSNDKEPDEFDLKVLIQNYEDRDQ
ncbi:MAG: hypothetical protein PHX51_04395 [Clostridia bacterium]|nr:hypothetical protein [Clostridia bacterium]